jgi:hypothetical protein
MIIHSPKLATHGGVISKDGIIMHHLENRVSTEEVYGGFYRKVTTHILRHKDLIK